MRLQQVKLSGFKSFVDVTAIDVYGQLVGIVGPNGCGKSNVIDAVRWVLGESSARQLRGESMMDVIFNGSIKRKPVSRATVELVFDNTQKSLHGLWNTYDEVSIKRLISRQGESIYYINNQQVRRKDITDLFLGTGVGTKGYAVIEQGMIGKIIESKPEDMRAFIEEAAGVSKYRERRRETLLRLADTAENLQRLEDIHSEIINQLEKLQEQAQVATTHQNLSQELGQTKLLSLAIKIKEATSILTDASQFIGNCEDELRVLGYQLEEINEQLAIEQDKKIEKEIELQDLVSQFNELRTNLARVEERYKHYSDLLKRFENESVDLASKENDINHEIELLKSQAEEHLLQIDDNQIELSEIGFQRENQQVMVEDQQEIYDKIATQVANRQTLLSALKHELDLLNNSLSHKRQQKSNLSARLAKLEQETQTLDFDQDYHFIKEEIDLVNDELVTCEFTLEEKSQKLESSQDELIVLNKQKSDSDKELAAVEAKITTISKLLNNNESVNIDIIHSGEIWENITVKDGYEKAVEAAINNILTAKIVTNNYIIEDVPQQKIALWWENSASLTTVSGSLAEYVTINNNAINNLYSYLNNVKLIDKTEANKLHNNEIGVTLDGHLLTRDFIIYNPNHGGNNLIQLQNEILKLKQHSEDVQITLETVNASLALKQTNEQNLKNDVTSLEAKLKRLLSKKHDLQLEFTKQEQIYLQNQRHQERVSQELKLLQNDIGHLSDDIEELEIKLDDSQINYEENSNSNYGIELEKVEAETSLQLAKNRLQEIDSRSNKLIVDNQLLKQQQQHSLNMIEEKSLQLQAAKNRLSELSKERSESSNNNQAQEIIKLQEEIAEVTKNMQSVQEELNKLSDIIINFKNKSGAINSNYQRNLEKINQTKFRVQEQQILLSTYEEQIENDEIDESTLAELVNQNNKSVTEINAKIKVLEKQIEDLGLVNLKAIEDLNDANSKEQELIAQISDLQLAKTTLEDAISHIDNETRKLLQKTFDDVNEAIIVYFRTLFGGGNARLALTDKDILSAGMQIYAEPPGKKNSTIHLLSGGEKALAAMSFIFALFSLNPAPFCLLDEVDAPLDDANTQRFCNLVKELSNKTQFVYISHNRLAMEMADQLVGVTMQEKGVSTTVSVSLIEAIKHTEETKQ
ncbi:MAG: chromosome segregation protein SMC [Burkholderiales bacterium]|nr:chromosome segregation protein SMC [Burkholderiales bacterium]